MSDRSQDKHDTPQGRFWLKRLHSLSGVVPVGLFLLFHFFTNAKAVNGKHNYDEAVAAIQTIPYLPFVEVGTVLLPLTFHAIYGIVLTFSAKPNVGVYATNRNWMYVAQRATGMLTFAFVIWHLSHYWLPKMRGEMATTQFYSALCADLSSTYSGLPLVALGYVTGVGAASFHLANGLWGFCCTWGITVTKRAQRRSATLFGIFGLLVFFLGANTAIYFATGSRIAVFGKPAQAQSSLEPQCGGK